MNADQNQRQTSVRAAMTAFIEALRRRLEAVRRETPLPEELEPHVRQTPSDEDLAVRFMQAATSVGLEVHAASPANWMNVVSDILRGHDAHAVIVQLDADSPLGERATDELGSRLSADGFAPTTAVDDETLFSADAGVTSVAAAIAETGTIVCPSGPGLARGASLIPLVHVAVVHTAQLVADLYDYFDRLSPAGELPANINLITGPSKTADIEGILVTGVHGPGHVHVVLISP
jgi:L-lactate dehydrogenase complex protein LldG